MRKIAAPASRRPVRRLPGGIARRRMPALLVAAAILTIWFVARTFTSEAEADAAPPPPRVVIEAGEFPEVPVIVDPGANAYGAASERNVFAYDDPPPVVAQPEPVPVVVAPEPVPVIAEPVAPEPPRPPAFPYRVLGRVGPFAVLTRDGEITNVKAGDTIGGEFVLRSIGAESVEIGFVHFPDVKKIPIGE